MYQFRQILKTDLINLFTNPMWLFYGIGFPLLLTYALGFLTKNSYGSLASSYDYYGPAMLVFSALNAATLAANSFMENRIKSPNLRIIYSPVQLYFIPFSKGLATFLFTTVCYTLTAVILTVTVGVNWGGPRWIFCWILLLITELFASALSIWMCCLLKSEEAVNQSLSNFISLAALLGGIFFPVNGLGTAIEVISNISPVKWIIAAVFQVIYDNNYSLYLITCLSLFALTGLFLTLTKKSFRSEDYL